jgi:hypothetical protein
MGRSNQSESAELRGAAPPGEVMAKDAAAAVVCRKSLRVIISEAFSGTSEVEK